VGSNNFGMVVTGNLLTTNIGALRMQNAGGTLQINGSATFSGSGATGNLTAGLLRLKGDFNNTVAAGFQASGTHVTEFGGPVGVGTAIQNVTMTSPGTGATNSRFNRLQMLRSNAGTALVVKLNLLTSLQAGNVIDSSAGRNDSILGTGTVTLTTDSIQFQNTVLNNVPLVVTNQSASMSGNTVRFENMNPLTTYLSFTRTNTSISLSFSNFTFATARSGAGRYLNVTTTGTNATGAFVSFTTSTTAGTFLAANSDYTRAFSGASTQLPTISWNGASNP
jgi:hypothetical protein